MEKRCVKIQRGEGNLGKGLLLGYQQREAERKELSVIKETWFWELSHSLRGSHLTHELFREKTM